MFVFDIHFKNLHFFFVIGEAVGSRFGILFQAPDDAKNIYICTFITLIFVSLLDFYKIN